MAYLGNFKDSSKVTCMPSLARAAAAYEPAGPPPMIRTWVNCQKRVRGGQMRGRDEPWAGEKRRRVRMALGRKIED